MPYSNRHQPFSSIQPDTSSHRTMQPMRDEGAETSHDAAKVGAGAALGAALTPPPLPMMKPYVAKKFNVPEPEQLMISHVTPKLP